MGEELDKNNGRDMTPQLIKDLGMRYPTEKSRYKSRYGLYECQCRFRNIRKELKMTQLLPRMKELK